MKYVCIACSSVPCVYDDGNILITTPPPLCPRGCVYCKWEKVDDDYVRLQR